ncbi:MAG: hypothetical protein Q9160_008390 [Pyrenula sp. 1 TL-2023]
MLFALFAFLSLLSLQAAPATASNENDGLKIADDFAAYTGKLEDGIKVWRGVQYAKPPTKAEGMRFKLPVDPKKDQGDVDATADRKSGHDEDCLYLNIYAPASAASLKLPVAIWISGGGMKGLADGYRDGKDFVTAAGNDIIFVSFSYRVGIFGFLASDELKKEGRLNFGLHDQRKAIEWVNRFIDRFGGDPNHVTIMGGSAGGGSVAYHLAASTSSETRSLRRRGAGARRRGTPQPKFAGAIAQSPSSPPVLTVSQSLYQWNSVVGQSGCKGDDIIGCLRDKSQDDILKYSNSIPYDGRTHAPIYMWNPVVDGSIVPDLPFNVFSKGAVNKVPAIFGSDSFDGLTFPPPTPVKDNQGAKDFLSDNFPSLDSDQLQKLVESAELMYTWSPNPEEHSERLYGDIRYQCAAVFYASNMAKAQSSKNVWAYQYNVGTDDNVGHMAETVALLGPALSGDSGNAVMQRHWIHFIKSLTPDNGWSAFDPSNPKRMVFTEAGGTMTDLDKGKDANLKTRCNYLAGIGAKLLQ